LKDPCLSEQIRARASGFGLHAERFDRIPMEQWNDGIMEQWGVNAEKCLLLIKTPSLKRFCSTKPQIPLNTHLVPNNPVFDYSNIPIPLFAIPRRNA
jgi:hypothetical protein